MLHLGITTDTQDMSGAVLKERGVSVTEEEVKEVLRSFVGEQMQVPPMYSALKVDGKKLYDAGKRRQNRREKGTSGVLL